MRSLLETVELNAVATARARGRNRSEIATVLHQSKQAAWEKWHGLDPEPTESRPEATLGARAGGQGPEGRAVRPPLVWESGSRVAAFTVGTVRGSATATRHADHVIG